MSKELPVPQQARSVASRRRLLEAAVACLIERGHAGTTTTEVAKRAGLSQGALYKHFPSKAQLMGATAEHLFAQLIVGFRAGFESLAAEGIADLEARLDLALEQLWMVFRSPPLAAAIELYVAARTDDELADTLTPILAQHTSNLRLEAARLFPELSDYAGLGSLIAGVMSSMQGAALVARLHDGADERAFIFRAVRRECLDALASISSTP